ncbi:hypothetical protein GHT06_020733 [Daphnia sinensis]|uniref:Uncharacterized protein n=1 Tax=Daphnia sinensis TaxID=1820382 RepID=A0AAD5KYI6_9CRUS|nr:hypothetical protein GHT06_020733 [Daphnia sinensis]
MVKFCFVALALLVACCAIQAAPSYDDDVEAAWEKFQAHHPHKADATPQEIAKRKGNFAKTHAMIEKHNKNKDATFQMEHNKFSAMDDDEKKQYNGARPPPHHDGSRFLNDDDLAVSMRQLPASLDYRTDVCLASVKNQGSCGSCWAFTAISPLEFAQCKKSGTPVVLSEQQLVDCDTSNGDCNGGWYTTAWNYLKNGCAQQSLYTYTATKNTCKYTSAMSASKVSSYGYVTSNSTAFMQAALQKYGPLAVAITVVDSLFSYKSGVYSDPTCVNRGVNHGVVVVGYGDLYGTPHWIVRNSWGSNWGSSGYVLMQRGVNMCNIELYPAAIVTVV